MAKRKTNIIICTCQAIIFWTLANCVTAASIYVSGSDIYYNGKVVWEDQFRLEEIIKNNPQTNRVVIRNSPGGDLYAGIDMGKTIRKYGLETHLIGECSSACNHIFAGGFFRNMEDNARLGLHIGGRSKKNGYYTEYDMYELQRQAASTMVDRVYHYMSMGIGLEVLKIMSTKNIYDIRWMYKYEAKQTNFINK